jgi:hypothetical protein
VLRHCSGRGVRLPVEVDAREWLVPRHRSEGRTHRVAAVSPHAALVLLAGSTRSCLAIARTVMTPYFCGPSGIAAMLEVPIGPTQSSPAGIDDSRNERCDA